MRCGRVGGREELTKSRPMGSTSHSGEHHLDDVEVEGDGDEDRHNAGWFQDDCDYVDRDDEDDYDDDVMLMLRETVREGWVSEVGEGQFPYLYFWPC